MSYLATSSYNMKKNTAYFVVSMVTRQAAFVDVFVENKALMVILNCFTKFPSQPFSLLYKTLYQIGKEFVNTY
jgi:hypothetical protein